ncbi:hypothetical protein [Streptomyces sp. ALI-76-A]|uniref:hypothetical protein n=1 Tax=Streptomyces sp. ALI-76-A TaxID=3025736 RepID=UPI00256F2F18|nr:hypothetical protein [Streptomyces sp. ALI-76-A]MDL5206605.1 hypothetical protein [Streptomyces sp. ALI-76-A]
MAEDVVHFAGDAGAFGGCGKAGTLVAFHFQAHGTVLQGRDVGVHESADDTQSGDRHDVEQHDQDQRGSLQEVVELPVGRIDHVRRDPLREADDQGNDQLAGGSTAAHVEQGHHPPGVRGRQDSQGECRHGGGGGDGVDRHGVLLAPEQRDGEPGDQRQDRRDAGSVGRVQEGGQAERGAQGRHAPA